MLDEIRDDILHILMCIFAYKKKLTNIDGSISTSLYASEVISLNALAEIIIVRVARLGDNRKDARSIRNLRKRLTDKKVFEVKEMIDQFHRDVEPVLKLRHERIAHMKTGILSTYPLSPFPREVGIAVCSLVQLVDAIVGEEVSYTLSHGNHSSSIDLRQEIFTQTVNN